MNRYLIDTDWAIRFLRGEPRVTAALRSVPRRVLHISVVTLAELYEGAFASRDPVLALRGIDDLFPWAGIVGLDRDTARLFGEQRARLRRVGLLIDSLDVLIAATCLRHGFRLLTDNVRHFERIEGLEIGLDE